MTHRATMHDLALMQGCLALEIIGHDTGSVRGPATLALDAENGLIMLRVRDVGSECAFMSRAFPCASTANQIEMPPLDVEGFSCLAFYSNDLAEDTRRLLDLGAHDSTEQFGITVNRRDLSIVMLRSPGGVILELVKVNR
jgi:hypothetical protein